MSRPCLSPAAENPGRKDDPGVTDILHASYIVVAMVDGSYRIEFMYRDNIFKDATVERLMDLWIDELIGYLADAAIVADINTVEFTDEVKDDILNE